MSTPILPFAFWASGTNQNSIPANDNSRRNQIINGEVISQAIAAQPGSPAEGDIYIIAAGPTGAQWAGFTAKDLAIYSSGTWYAFAPVEGVVVNVAGTLYKFAGGVWAVVVAGAGGTAWGDLTGVPAAVDNIGDLVDPNADRLLFWDDSAGALVYLTIGTNLSITGTTIDAAGGSVTQCIPIACSDETTALTVGVAKVTFRMPFAMTLTGVRASVTTAPTGSVMTVDINESGASILSTKITIDATEKTSTTAAAAPVISDAALADDAEVTIDIDTVGSTIAGAGLKVYLIGTV